MGGWGRSQKVRGASTGARAMTAHIHRCKITANSRKRGLLRERESIGSCPCRRRSAQGTPATRAQRDPSPCTNSAGRRIAALALESTAPVHACHREKTSIRLVSDRAHFAIIIFTNSS